jgi:hypothetical protein
MDGFDDITRGRLFKSIELNFRNLEPFRLVNAGLVREYAGPGYGQPSDSKRDDMINLLKQAVNAYMMTLVANRPRVMVSTANPSLDYFAKHFKVAINNLIQEIGLEYTLRQWVLDAFFSIGITKVHFAESAMVQLEQDLWADPGQPFVSNVSIDNFVFDGGANSWEQIRFAADMYRIPYEDLQSDIYDQDVVDEIDPTSKSAVEGERLERITRGEEVDADEFMPMVDVADVWVPRHGKIYTYAVANRYSFTLKGRPLAAIEDKLGTGPYDILGFDEIPENIMPASPAADLAGLSRLTNNLFRKQSRRAKSGKRLHTYEAGEADTVGRIKKAADDDFIKANDPRAIGEVNIGGVDPQLQAFMLGTMEVFDRQAGNLTAMLGLGAQADTVGQEQLIHSAGSKKEAKMQYKVVDATARLIRKLAKLLWIDAVKVIPGQIPIDGAPGYAVDATWTPDDREGDFIDYDLEIDIYSMLYQTPGQKSNALLQLITQVYAPLAQMLMAQGGSFNMQELTDVLAEMANLPELRKVIQFATVPMDVPGQEGGGGMAPVSTRNYVRRNVPSGGTPQSRAALTQQAWMGMSGNSQQQAQMAN